MTTATAAAPPAAETPRPTMAELVAAWGVTVTITRSVPVDPALHPHDPAATVSDVVLAVAGETTTVRFPFMMGSGNPHPRPTAEEALNALAVDAGCATATFQELLDDFGIDPADEIAVARYRKIWRAGVRIRRVLGVVLGPERLQVLLDAEPL